VYEGHRDNVLGFLFARDLIGVDTGSMESSANEVMKFLREPYLVPESKPVHDLFHTFHRRKLSVALTVDEYGGITGLITMEDLLECIFGDLPSPSDQMVKIEYEKLSDDTARVPGEMRVSEFNREFSTTLHAGKEETIGGLLLREHGELPPEGTRITLGDYAFEVVELQSNRIESILIRRLAGEVDAEQPPGDSAMPPTGAAPGESPDTAAAEKQDRKPGED